MSGQVINIPRNAGKYARERCKELDATGLVIFRYTGIKNRSG